MQDETSLPPRIGRGRPVGLATFVSQIREGFPSASDSGMAGLAGVLLILSFPDFELWPLAWIGLAPLFAVIVRRPQPIRAFILGWLFGGVFFYGSCYWLTYSMIHFGGIPRVAAYALLIPAALVVGIFPALCASVVAQIVKKWGPAALFLAPVFWAALEWARLGITGQLWNAIGYSHAFQPMLIQPARWGGVYLVGFLIVFVNVAVVYAVIRRTPKAVALSGLLIAAVALVCVCAQRESSSAQQEIKLPADANVVAIQPNVPMDLIKSVEDLRKLATRHFEMSEAALRKLPTDGKARLVIWPESPMNFDYGGDAALRERLTAFTKTNNTAVLLNSQEAAPDDGIYNSALLINQEGNLVTQYDKIRLLPFGEYVPLPHWLPGAGLIRGMVGDFTPGTDYRLMPVGSARVGVFICIESAYPSVARSFANTGADALINISNDGYLGPTAVMRQHLANVVFRAVENGRPVLRVTNTGITALVTPAGEVQDSTAGFQPEVRIWSISRSNQQKTFYAAHGDLFAAVCAGLGVVILLLSFRRNVSRRDKAI